MKNKLTDPERIAYWQKRIEDRIMSAYRQLVVDLKAIQSDMDHIGINHEESRLAIGKIGEGFDMLSFTLGKKQKNEKEAHE